MAQHNDTGSMGEQMVVDWLTACGWAIRERNWHMNHLEVDIIATRDDVIAFVEVKTRRNGFTDPLDAIDRRKMRHMAQAAEAYLHTLPVMMTPRFDVASVLVEGAAPGEAVEYIEDAFEPPLLTY